MIARAVRSFAILAMLLAAAPVSWGQAQGNIVALGYNLPQWVNVAPGQLITILVQGIDAPSQRVYAGAGKWPATLAGISATLSGLNAGPGNLALPIGSVFPFGNCIGVSCAGATMTGLTVQFPFEMFGPSPSQPGAPSGSTLTVSDASGNTANMLVIPISDQIHVVRSGDTLDYGSGGGVSLVTHADGSTVSASSPAKQHEVVTMYAAGLGVTTPVVASGLPSPIYPLAYTQHTFTLNYAFAANTSQTPSAPAAPLPAPLFVGLAPGFVGLYQINFEAFAPAGTPPCSATILSNVIVTLVGAASSDGAGFCIDMGAP